jgi:hypothetical protein
MRKCLFILLTACLSAFTLLPNKVQLVRAGVTDTIELKGREAVKFSEDVLFRVHNKDLRCNLAVYFQNKTLEGSGYVVLWAAPDLTIMAEEFTYDERQEMVHFTSNVQVKTTHTTAYATVSYNFKTNKIQNAVKATF